jgi:acyl carrier protein
MQNLEKAWDVLTNAISQECGVDLDRTAINMNLLNDLDVDSLDLLNTAFAIERDCGVKIPIQDWLREEYSETSGRENIFSLGTVAAFIAKGLEPKSGQP